MEYNLKPKTVRPPGMGAFFDYDAALKRHFARAASRARSWRKRGLAAQPEDSAEDRWDAEGGNSQSRQKNRGQSPKT